MPSAGTVLRSDRVNAVAAVDVKETIAAEYYMTESKQAPVSRCLFVCFLFLLLRNLIFSVMLRDGVSEAGDYMNISARFAEYPSL